VDGTVVRGGRRVKLTVIGQRVRHARDKLDVSQHQLAELSGVNRSTIANVEVGRHDPSVSALIRIAAALNVDPGYLLRPAVCDCCGDVPPHGFACLVCDARTPTKESP
jgi:DNA-binding XRE family transcriptional regulator